MNGMRKPNKEEIQKVARYYKTLCGKDMKRCTAMGVISAILAILCLSGLKTGGIFSAAAVIVLVLLAVAMFRGRKKAKSLTGIFVRGEFQVMDGSVYDIHANTDFPNMHNVKFCSDAGCEVGSWWAVRDEDIKIGTQLLLVYVSRQTAKQEIKKVFTPFMLTEEGLKGTMVH